MFRGKSWFSGNVLKPRNPHSLDHLKFLYQILSKNQVVTEQNKSLLVETLRSIAEILIWGDQNDSTVFDFFLEKNMLSFFLKIMKQKCGSYVCVQLLQTLNILFENIRNETSLYYLLSNNHVNSIIVHKFDFSDEEVMAYYISFLKTLSLKLNNHTIHFFYNEHTNDFPLYTEAIKFFNHSESMVRIAVRTLTLNVFRVEDKAMLKFIRDRTAAPYFSNLVYFIGKHVLELDGCVRQAVATNGEAGGSRLADLVAEHLDHLHYLHDILSLNIAALNAVLSDHLLNRLLIPLYVYSLIAPATPSHGTTSALPPSPNKRPHVSRVVALFLLSQVFLIISHQPLVRHLAQVILNGDLTVFGHHHDSSSSANSNGEGSEPGFVAPEEPLEKSLESSRSSPSKAPSVQDEEEPCKDEATQVNNLESTLETLIPTEGTNITDEEKAKAAQRLSQTMLEQIHQSFSLSDRPFLDAIFQALDCTDNDQSALFSLCLLYALGHNSGINQDLLSSVLLPSDKPEAKTWYNITLAEHLIKIINLSCQYNSRVRLATLQMALTVLEQLVIKEGRSFLQDSHLAAIEQSREEATLLLRNFYKSEEIFLDMFEDEYQEIKKKPLNVEYLTMDASLLLPPAGTPMSGVEFHKRLPCGEVERAKRTIRVFFLLRSLSLKLQGESESQLPLTNLADCIKVDDVLDLNNSDLIACTVVSKDGQKTRRFMVIDKLQLVLVEPDTKRLGWGVAKFVGFLQDIEVMGDKDDSRCLHLTVHRPAVGGGTSGRRSPLLAARFLFDDHIRCLAAKQRLTKGRLKARQTKMHRIARLLDLPEHIQPCPSPLRHSLHNTPSRHDHSGVMHRSQSQDTGLRGRTSGRLLSSGAKVPGFAAKLKPSATLVPHQPELPECSSGSHSREASPCPLGSEEIPLEDLSRGSRSASSGNSSSYLRRKSSTGLPQARISAPPSLAAHYPSSSSSHQRSCPIHTEEALSSSVPIPLSHSTPRCAPTDGHSPDSPPCSKPCCVMETTREEIEDSPSEAPPSKGSIQTV